MPASKDISDRENKRLSPSPDEIYRDSISSHAPDGEEYVPKTKLDALADKIHPPFSHGLGPPVFVAHPAISVCVPFQGPGGIPGQRKRKPADLHAGRGKKHPGATGIAEIPVSPATSDGHYGRAPGYRFRLRSPPWPAVISLAGLSERSNSSPQRHKVFLVF